MPGPPGAPRRVAESDFIGTVAAAARRRGVTRLADITGLDRIGLPVWQAVRPAGRALSVHQGKGRSALAARIGALCEAIESDCAERAAADGPRCAWSDLPPGARAAHLSDFARIRARPPAPSQAVAWTCATDLVSGGDFFLPHDLVSLDFTRALPSRFDRSSSGLAVGAGEAEAVTVALCELIERDSVGAWRRTPFVARLGDALDADTIPFAWFGHWRERLRALGCRLRLFAPPAPAGLPVILCWLSGGSEFGGRRSFAGSAGHSDPEQALFGAFAEAVQSRLTFIAGVRDDIFPGDHEVDREADHMPAPPVPPGAPVRGWSEIAPGPAGKDALIERLAREGHDRIVARRLDAPGDGLAVVKCFVAGLGSGLRSRRGAR